MSKLISYIVAALVVAGTAGGAYYYFTRVEVVTVQMPSPNPPEPPASVPKPKPEHGDFQKRFEPKMPPPDSGKSK
jgi:hypothetical protein